MTRDEQRKRHEEIVADFKRDKNAARVAVAFNVCTDTIHKAIRAAKKKRKAVRS